MIEINRGLYMCGNDKDEEGYRRVKKDIAGLIAGLRKKYGIFYSKQFCSNQFEQKRFE